jgi:hypothetical protein
MYLGAYHFDGEATRLLAAYDRLMASYPPDTMLLHACLLRSDGITVLDACPSQSVFDEFSTSPPFRAAISAAGLPDPRVEGLGDVSSAYLSEAVAR